MHTSGGRESVSQKPSPLDRSTDVDGDGVPRRVMNVGFNPSGLLDTQPVSILTARGLSSQGDLLESRHKLARRGDNDDLQAIDALNRASMIPGRAAGCPVSGKLWTRRQQKVHGSTFLTIVRIIRSLNARFLGWETRDQRARGACKPAGCLHRRAAVFDRPVPRAARNQHAIHHNGSEPHFA